MHSGVFFVKIWPFSRNPEKHFLRELLGENCERPDHLTDPHLGPVAGAVVPLDAVVVPGVQDGQAGLHSDARPLEEIFSIVRLSNLVGHELWEVASVGPGVLTPPGSRLVCGGNPDSGPGPEPTVDMLRLQMGSLEH